MANKLISMSIVRQIMKFYSRGIGKKKIAQRLGVSKNTVKFYIESLHELLTPWDELLKLSDLELNQRLHPAQETIVNARIKQLYDFFPEMEKQMRRRGMTVLRQFKEFKKKHPEGCAETTFYKYYNKWKKRVYPVMHIEHKVGDMVYVDYAGATLPYVDTDTGEIKKAQVFVAILGWSQYTYVEAMPSQTIEDFIAASENALRYFKGSSAGHCA